MANGFIPYTPTTPLRYWVQAVLPLVYDDSLSYMELLSKVIAKLNDMAQSLNQMGESLNTLNDAIDALQAYVDNKLSDDNLSALITNIVTELLSTGDFNLPVASSTRVGGIKVGNNLTISADGTLSSQPGYTLPPATTSILGGVKVGQNLTVTNDGTLNAGSFSLQPATASALGGVKIPTNGSLNVGNDGTLTAKTPTATVPGVVKAGTGISISGDGTISATGEGTATDVEWSEIKNVPIASTSTLGVVKTRNGYGVQVNTSGELYVAYASNTVTGGVRTGGNVTVSSTDGTMNYTLPQATDTVKGGIIYNSDYLYTDENGKTCVAKADDSDVPTASTTEAGILKVPQDNDTACYMLDGGIRTRYATTSQCGAVRVGSGLVANGGTLKVATGTVTGTFNSSTSVLSLTLST